MATTRCGHCGAEGVYISEANKDAGAEVYCSEACARGEPRHTPTHTPTPWEVHPRVDEDHPKYVAAVVKGSDPEYPDSGMWEVAYVVRGAEIGGVDSAPANAELIVRAVNSHADLLAACELIVAVKHCMMFLHIHDEQSMDEVLKKHGAASVQLLAKMAQDAATTAIAKAKGE